MTKLISLFVVVLALAAGTAFAIPMDLGTSGSVLTPDDIVQLPGQFNVNYNGISLDGQTATTLGATIGVTDNMEVGLTRLDPGVDAASIETLVNLKYSLLPETAVRPSVVIGAVDMTGAADPDGDGGFYALIGKSLTSVASEVTGRPSKPLHGYVGFGGGIYDGIFAGLSWQLTSNLRVTGEFIEKFDLKDVLSGKNMINVGAGFTFNDSLSGTLQLIDGDNFGFGLTYGKSF